MRLHELFEEQVERTPDAVALVFEHKHLAYRELNRRANQLSHHLHELGIGSERLVGVCMDRSPEMVVAILGALKTGGDYVLLDPVYPLDRVAFMVDDSRASVLLTERRLVEELKIGDWRSEIGDWKAPPETIHNPQSVIRDPQSVIRDSRSATGNPQQAIRNSQCKVVCIDAIVEALASRGEENPVREMT